MTLPDVASATRLLDLQADALALSDGDPVSTWPDQSGNGHNFTSVGNFRPTFVASNVDTFTPAIYFDGNNDYMVGDNWIDLDNLDSFSLFVVSDLAGGDSVTKMNNYSSGAGWAISSGAQTIIIQEDGGSNWIEKDYVSDSFYGVSCMEVVSKSELHLYINGSNSNEIDKSSPPVSNYSTTEKVVLGMYGDLSGSAGAGYISAVLFYTPAPSASDRSAIEGWIAAKYGIVL